MHKWFILSDLSGQHGLFLGTKGASFIRSSIDSENKFNWKCYLEMINPTLQQVVWFEVTIKDPEDDYYDYEYGLGKSYFQICLFSKPIKIWTRNNIWHDQNQILRTTRRWGQEMKTQKQFMRSINLNTRLQRW